MRSAIPYEPSLPAAAAPLAGLALPAPVAEPILAGMRARAVADLCEALRIPAILLDHEGCVLHVTSLAANELETGEVSLVGGRLHGNSEVVDRRLRALLADTVGGAAHNGRMHRNQALGGEEAGPSLMTVDYKESSAYQRLRALLVFGDATPLATAMLARGGEALHS